MNVYSSGADLMMLQLSESTVVYDQS